MAGVKGKRAHALIIQLITRLKYVRSKLSDESPEALRQRIEILENVVKVFKDSDPFYAATQQKRLDALKKKLTADSRKVSEEEMKDLEVFIRKYQKHPDYQPAERKTGPKTKGQDTVSLRTKK